MELGKTCFFENTKAGFHSFLNWITQLVKGCKLNQVIVGMEPTGHYWLNLAHLLKENKSVNPLHVTGVGGGKINGADASLPSNVDLPKAGKWALLVYIDGKLFDTLVMDIKGK
ncbi:hypothetical protein ACIQY5_24570 [Peribacillus frigoritolerans]|uniref:hypothetical protein n=1 Tax=Peribacillus frigoritolerans TaxID=450367 RepID=UPI0037F35073